MRKYLLLFFIVLVANANYIVNGDFEQPTTTGWTFEKLGINGGAYQGTLYDPADPDYEVYVLKSGDSGSVKLYQTRDVPSTNLYFSVHAKLYARTSYASYWAGAAVILSYLNSSGVILGETRICQKTTSCPWSNSSTMHLIINSDTLYWYDYSFNVNDELTNLPGVNPAQINKIRVSLFDSIIHC